MVTFFSTQKMSSLKILKPPLGSSIKLPQKSFGSVSCFYVFGHTNKPTRKVYIDYIIVLAWEPSVTWKLNFCYKNQLKLIFNQSKDTPMV